jgi:proteasome maturation protein
MMTFRQDYGVGDRLKTGLTKKADTLSAGHPLEQSESHFSLNRDMGDMKQLRMIQGMHAPLKIQMEKMALSQVGHLPCISQRSNLLLDVITGRDETIGFEDLYGKPEDYEGMTGLPHNAIEKSLGNM